MSDANTYTEAETKARAEAALKRMLTTQHKPREKLKKGGPRPAQKLPEGAKSD